MKRIEQHFSSTTDTLWLSGPRWTGTTLAMTPIDRSQSKDPRSARSHNHDDGGKYNDWSRETRTQMLHNDPPYASQWVDASYKSQFPRINAAAASRWPVLTEITTDTERWYFQNKRTKCFQAAGSVTKTCQYIAHLLTNGFVNVLFQYINNDQSTC